MKAAVFHAAKQPLTVEDVEIDRPKEHEVLVRTVASGVCHSDLHFVDGLYPLSWATRPPASSRPWARA
jgi:S-(hydroxymethyl)glutathione dehydrogenase/alcohol dehydrogenase